MFKKKLMLPILAVIVGIAASAFTVSNTSNNQDDPTWTYVGPATQNQDQLNNPENYQLGTSTCGGSTDICTIEAPSDGQFPAHPVIDVNTEGNVTPQNSNYSPRLKN